ncbi:MAG: hypothetical protein IJ757_08570 [Clostridiales bacterium]|nr:hypothetical protein [Clostridiales bacterium]
MYNFKSAGTEMQDFKNPLHNHQDEAVDGLTNEVKKLNLIICAMWQAMMENGISQEQLHAKIDEVLSDTTKYVRRSYEPQIIKCPQCGKAIQESKKNPMIGRCLYCGKSVTFYPYSDATSVDNEVIEEHVDINPFDPKTNQNL